MLEVARGLEYIHLEGVVHGDLSAVSSTLTSLFTSQVIFSSFRQMSSLMPNSAAISLILD